eukprot:8854363-Alexandrium_andersonii.AAC.1
MRAAVSAKTTGRCYLRYRVVFAGLLCARGTEACGESVQERMPFERCSAVWPRNKKPRVRR